MKKYYFMAIFAILLSACSKDKDVFDSDAAASKELKNAEDHLGVKIDPNQTWVTTNNLTVTIGDLPTDLLTQNILIMDVNPLVDSDAQVLANASASDRTIKLEIPQGQKMLYAAAIDANGDVRVASFEVTEPTVSFKAEQGYAQIQTPAAARRAMAKAKAPLKRSELQWKPTVQAKMYADKGWNDEWAYIESGDVKTQFTNMAYYTDIVLSFLPEAALNFRDTLNKAEMVRNDYYAIVGKGGGEVIVTPIYRNTSNRNSRVGYYYFTPGDERNIKTARKYLFEEPVPMNYHNKSRNDIPQECTIQSYKLIYYDAEGNPSYDFPEGTEIGFFNNVDQQSNMLGETFNWYNEGEANSDLSGYFKEKNVLPDWAKAYNVSWETYSHTVMFQRGGNTFICFEDWVQDFDMNDIVLLVNEESNVEPAPVAPTHSCKENIRFYRYSYGFEDTRNGDYDMNDVVLRVWRPSLQKNQLTIEVAACGASDSVYIFYNTLEGERLPLFSGKEVHQLFRELGYDAEFYNTESINAPTLPKMTLNINNFNDFNYARADFFIVNKTKNLEVHMPAALGIIGGAPFGICAPQKAWAWPKERISIVKAYNPYFGPYAADHNVNVDWYMFPVEDKVIYYDTAN
jgi:hypothetical protein